MIVTWLANAASPRPEPAGAQPGRAPVAGPARAGPDTAAALAFDVEREAGRLRLRVADAPAPRRSGRNPFRFAERAVETPAPLGRPVSVAPAPDAEPAVLPTPAAPLKLIGIAERATEEGTVRSAVLAGPGDVFIVGVEDQVLSRFTVVAIAAEAIELTDALTGQALRLAMR
jgi:hypothetical protein